MVTKTKPPARLVRQELAKLYPGALYRDGAAWLHFDPDTGLDTYIAQRHVRKAEAAARKLQRPKSIGQRIVKGLKQFQDDLEAGKEIEVTTVNRKTGEQTKRTLDGAIRERRKLHGAGGRSKISGSKSGAADVGRPKSAASNKNDPRGQFGEFLYAWIAKHHEGDEERLATALGMTDRAIRKWCEGKSGPAFSDLDRVAKALGMADWTDLAIAVRKFHRK